MSDIELARDQLVTKVLRYLSAERALQDPLPHASAEYELEYAEEKMDEAARQLSSHLSATENTGPRCGWD